MGAFAPPLLASMKSKSVPSVKLPVLSVDCSPLPEGVLSKHLLVLVMWLKPSDSIRSKQSGPSAGLPPLTVLLAISVLKSNTRPLSVSGIAFEFRIPPARESPLADPFA